MSMVFVVKMEIQKRDLKPHTADCQSSQEKSILGQPRCLSADLSVHACGSARIQYG